MKGADELKLTIKQKRFADEYIIIGNATDAYLKAYPSTKKKLPLGLIRLDC
ncbi:terminase small subunit [Helcococcus ovis]|uniref:terminase small subunit n=1 Tax=Helcococcus ovis TaxID=72026 RepID=UPI0038B7EDD2